MSTLSNALTATQALTGSTPRDLLFRGIDAGARALGGQPTQPLRSSRDVLGFLGVPTDNPLVGALAGAADVALDPSSLAGPAPGAALASGALKGAARTIPELADLVTAQESLGKYLQAYKVLGRDSPLSQATAPPGSPDAGGPALPGEPAPTPPADVPATPAPPPQPLPTQIGTPAPNQNPAQIWTPAPNQNPAQIWTAPPPPTAQFAGPGGSPAAAAVPLTPEELRQIRAGASLGPGGLDPLTAAALGLEPGAPY